MRFKRRKIKRGRIEIIPMIDTIVILLIFYMTFARLSAAQRANVTLPKSRAGDPYKQQDNQVVINMFSSDQVVIGQQTYTTADLPGILRGIKAAHSEKFENMAIILRGQNVMTYKDLSDFMKACSKAGIADVTFATLEGKAQ